MEWDGVGWTGMDLNRMEWGGVVPSLGLGVVGKYKVGGVGMYGMRWGGMRLDDMGEMGWDGVLLGWDGALLGFGGMGLSKVRWVRIVWGLGGIGWGRVGWDGVE